MKRTPLKRRTPLRARGRRGAADAAALEKARPLVWTRDGGRCQRCGGALHPARWDCHHIGRRRAGHAIDNLLALCRRCHRWIHEHPTESREAGFLR